MIMNCEMGMMWKKTVMVSFKILLWHCLKELRKSTNNHKKNWSSDQNLNLLPSMYEAGVQTMLWQGF